MRSKEKQLTFEKETDLCASFLRFLDAHNKTVTQSQNPNYDAHVWIPYPETAGWDILLVSRNDGTQIGIEAKLKLNVAVLLQCLPDNYLIDGSSGPDYRAILVPGDASQNGIGAISARLGITTIRYRGPTNFYKSGHSEPELPRQGPPAYDLASWTNWLPHQRCKLPEYVPDVIAGDAAPVQLTEWKIQALKLQAILSERALTRNDFKALKVSPTRWLGFWLDQTDSGWVRSNRMPDFAGQHPTIYQQVLADREKWMPSQLPLAKSKTI
jgi:hypothetical protein